MDNDNDSVVFHAVYEIDKNGNCLNCKCLIPLKYCKAFSAEFDNIKKVNGVFTPTQLQQCKNYLQIIQSGGF